MHDTEIKLIKFHQDQRRIYKNRSRFSVWRCGRRYGKTTAFESIASNWAAHGDKVGWFAPNYKLLLPSYKRAVKMLKPIIANASKTDALIELTTGGCIEFWTLDNEDAGRSRAYHHALIDEGSLVKKGLRDTWEQAIAPTLLDYQGDAIMAGTPKGIDDENYFYQACTNKKLGWTEFHAPTAANPMISREAIAKLPDEYPPLVYQQEYLAEFVNWAGAMFFSLQDILEDGLPVPYPIKTDTIYATLDSAVKTGSKNDGTAIVYWAYSRIPEPNIVILDWDIVQIEGSLLEVWLPSQLMRCQELADICGARYGSSGIHIEDKASGTILLQQGQRKNWPIHAIDSKFTAIGKEERAMSVSGYVHQKKVKISQYAYDKLTTYKEMTRNHFLIQFLGFKIGEKNDDSDDLLDAGTYGIYIGLNGSEAYT